MNYYNEFDPKAAAWIRELITRGFVPPGDVDERSIADVKPTELVRYTQCHFFAGIAGWPLALQLAGWPTNRPVWTGSCPCQSFSSAGKRKGTSDHRDLWPVFAALIRECRPPVVFGEQVASAIRFGWLDRVRTDLEAEGYAVGGTVLGAHSAGAPHIRQRLYWVAESKHSGHGSAGEPATEPGSDRADNGLPERDGGGVGDTEQRRECGGDQRGLGTAGREMGEPQDGQSGADESRHGCANAGWKPVVHSCECDEDGNFPRCGIDFSECGCPGPTQDGYEYTERDGVLLDRRVGESGSYGSEARISGQDKRQERNSGKFNHQGGQGFWSDAIWLPCRDGKARRVKPGLPLLANGVPARVVRLRGYGNAIVPQVAQAFIEAYLQSNE